MTMANKIIASITTAGLVAGGGLAAAVVIACLIGIGGLFTAVVARAFAGNSMLAVRDPRLAESMTFHNP